MNLKIIIFLLILLIPLANASINPDYKVSLEDNYIEFCAHTREIMPITIFNNANITNNYKIKATGGLWTHTNVNELTVNSRSSKIFNLVLTPDYTVSGTHIVKINIIPYIGNARALIKILANVKDCNSSKTDTLKEDSNKTPLLQKIKNHFNNVTIFNNNPTGDSVQNTENINMITKLKDIKNSIEKYQIYILISLIIIMLVLITRKTGFHKKILDFFDEEEVKKSNNKKIKKKTIKRKKKK